MYAAASPPSAPAVSSEAATSVTSTQATLGAEVNPEGADTQVYFNWGPTSSYGNVSPVKTGSLILGGYSSYQDVIDETTFLEALGANIANCYIMDFLDGTSWATIGSSFGSDWGTINAASTCCQAQLD